MKIQIIIVAIGILLFSCNQKTKKEENSDQFENQPKQEINAVLGNAENDVDSYLKKGQSIAFATKAVLGKNLLKAIQDKGVHGAVDFCNVKAIPLTDSMATNLKASIKRVSDKNRNPNNAANQKELEYIVFAKQELVQHGNAKPKVFEQNGKMVGYYPIITNDMCIKCHGNKTTDIDTKTLSAINKQYPNDKGTGYATNELRGIWVVEMKK